MMNGENLTQDHHTRTGSITRFADREFRRIISTILVMLAIIIAGCTLINSPPNISLLFIPDPTPLTGSTHQFYVVVDDSGTGGRPLGLDGVTVGAAEGVAGDHEVFDSKIRATAVDLDALFPSVLD